MSIKYHGKGEPYVVGIVFFIEYFLPQGTCTSVQASVFQGALRGMGSHLTYQTWNRLKKALCRVAWI